MTKGHDCWVDCYNPRGILNLSRLTTIILLNEANEDTQISESEWNLYGVCEAHRDRFMPIGRYADEEAALALLKTLKEFMLGRIGFEEVELQLAKGVAVC